MLGNHRRQVENATTSAAKAYQRGLQAHHKIEQQTQNNNIKFKRLEVAVTDLEKKTREIGEIELTKLSKRKRDK